MEQKEFQFYLDVTIDVLTRKDRNAINTLRHFLRSSPSPKSREQILMAAILHFAQYDHTVFLWIIAHQEDFRPELDLLAATRKLVISRLSNQGWSHGKDFQMTTKNILVINRTSKATLNHCCCQHELLLINTMLNVTT